MQTHIREIQFAVLVRDHFCAPSPDFLVFKIQRVLAQGAKA